MSSCISGSEVDWEGGVPSDPQASSPFCDAKVTRLSPLSRSEEEAPMEVSEVDESWPLRADRIRRPRLDLDETPRVAEAVWGEGGQGRSGQVRSGRSGEVRSIRSDFVKIDSIKAGEAIKSGQVQSCHVKLRQRRTMSSLIRLRR